MCEEKPLQDQSKEMDRHTGSSAVREICLGLASVPFGCAGSFYQTEDTELIRNLNMYVISRFYTKPYEESQDFYAQFYERLKEAKNLLSLGV